MAWTEPEPVPVVRRRWPWHRRLVVRYAGALMLVAIGSAVAVAGPLYYLAEQLLEQSMDDRLEGTAELAVLSLAPEDVTALGQPVDVAPELRKRLETVREEADLDALYLVRTDRVLTFCAGTCGAALDLTTLDQTAITAAAGVDSTHTPIQDDEPGFLDAYAPTSDVHLVLGVRASSPYLERLDDLQSLFMGAAGAWAAAVALLGAIFGARLTRPIERLLDATAKLAAGVEPAPPQPGGSAELDSLQEAFEAMAASVRLRERRLRALAGAVAHEVRNPSNALRLHLGLLRRNIGGDPERLHERIGVLEGELDALDATVDGFLLFAQDRTAYREPVALRSVLERAAEGATVEAPEAVVSVDPLLIGRAVSNLVRNAREAGGEPVTVRARIGAGELHIEVEDRGPGFPPELAPRAFEPFVSGRVGGSGIGLAIVAAVAAAHGGVATVLQTGPGRTVVGIRLPVG